MGSLYAAAAGLRLCTQLWLHTQVKRYSIAVLQRSPGSRSSSPTNPAGAGSIDRLERHRTRCQRPVLSSPMRSNACICPLMLCSVQRFATCCCPVQCRLRLCADPLKRCSTRCYIDRRDSSQIVGVYSNRTAVVQSLHTKQASDSRALGKPALRRSSHRQASLARRLRPAPGP